jgi:hypothetical protein
MSNTNRSPQVTLKDLIKLAEEINGGPLSEDVLNEIQKVEINESITPLENLPESAVRLILGESFDSTMGMPIPASLANAGNAYDTEVNHEFTKDNACSYFQKNELCALDGRICLYDSETFRVCLRYKEGYTRGIPGLDGAKPAVPPQSEMPRDAEQDKLPFNHFYRG